MTKHFRYMSVMIPNYGEVRLTPAVGFSREPEEDPVLSTARRYGTSAEGSWELVAIHKGTLYFKREEVVP